VRKLSWTKLADGRAWRLKQGKHFLAEPRAFDVEVQAAAARMGKVVRTLREELGKFNYLWVQFADHELQLGSPCPCGHTSQFRQHQFFGRCPHCGARLIYQLPKSELSAEQVALAASDAAALAEGDLPVSAPPPTPQEEHSEARVQKGQLDAYTGVELERYETKPGRERWRGHGFDAKGRRVLLLVEYPLDERQERLRVPENPGAYVHRLSAWPVDPFAELIDVERFDAGRGGAE
jgi:hypothetical protein